VVKATRQRYLAVKVDGEESFEERDIMDAVWRAMVQLFGEYGASQAGLFLVRYNRQNRQAILRCWLKALPMVKASIASVNGIKEKPVAFHTLKISGTLKALLRKMPNR